MAMSRILAIDYGRRRIGLAVSDPTRTIVSQSLTITVASLAEAVRTVSAYIKENSISEVVVGYPLREDGGKSDICSDVDSMIDSLADSHPDLEVHRSDERYTSAIARDIIHAVGGKVGKDKGKVDAKAAEIILRDFLESDERR
jgi:putative Holliday junction resolvase